MNVYAGLAILGVAIVAAGVYYWRNKAKAQAAVQSAEAAATKAVQDIKSKL